MTRIWCVTIFSKILVKNTCLPSQTAVAIKQALKRWSDSSIRCRIDGWQTCRRRAWCTKQVYMIPDVASICCLSTLPIWEYFISTLSLEASRRSKGYTLVFDGFTRVRGANKLMIFIAQAKVGEVLKLENRSESAFYQATCTLYWSVLVKELEKKGIITVHRLMLQLFQRFKNVVM